LSINPPSFVHTIQVVPLSTDPHIYKQYFIDPLQTTNRHTMPHTMTTTRPTLPTYTRARSTSPPAVAVAAPTHPCPHFGELVHAIVRAYSSPATSSASAGQTRRWWTARADRTLTAADMWILVHLPLRFRYRCSITPWSGILPQHQQTTHSDISH